MLDTINSVGLVITAIVIGALYVGGLVCLLIKHVKAFVTETDVDYPSWACEWFYLDYLNSFGFVIVAFLFAPIFCIGIILLWPLFWAILAYMGFLYGLRALYRRKKSAENRNSLKNND